MHGQIFVSHSSMLAPFTNQVDSSASNMKDSSKMRCILLLGFKTKTLPRRVHILRVVVLIGVQRVNGFKSGRGCAAPTPSRLNPDGSTRTRPCNLLPQPMLSSVDLYPFFQSYAAHAAALQKRCALGLSSSDPVQKRVHPVPALLIATLASPNCARLLC